MPQIEFRFLVCSYLPGFPFALAFYFALLHVLPTARDSNFFVLYFILVPLFLGLVFDAIRHGIELCKPIWHEPDRQEMRNGTLYGDSGLLHILSRSLNLYHVYEFFANLMISLLLTAILIVCICCFRLPGSSQECDPTLKLWYAAIALVLGGLCALFSYIFKREQDKRIVERYFRR